MPASDSLTNREGLTTIASCFSPKETMERLETEIQAKGMKVFARIDHAAGAAGVGLTLRPTELIIFGNAFGQKPEVFVPLGMSTVTLAVWDGWSWSAPDTMTVNCAHFVEGMDPWWLEY